MNLKPKTLSWLICAVLIAVTVLIYWPVLRSEFVIYDDDTYVTDNPHVNTGLTWNNVAWAFTSKEVSNWHPLTWLSHMLDVQIYGLHPWGHHLTNLLFHIANSLLLFYWLRQFTGALWRSALVAALFAWHPLHVESVAWVAERKDVLSTFFWLLALICYRKFQVRERDFPLFYATAIVCFVLGLMAKPMVVTLPFVLLLLDYWEYNRRGNARPPWWKLVKEKIPFFALAAISCYVTYVVQQEGGAMRLAAKYIHNDRILNSIHAFAKYVELIFWPHKLAVLYPLAVFSTETLAIAAIFLLVVSVCVAWNCKTRPYLLVGWCWFLGTLVPVIGLVQVGAQSMADRYTYIPSIGIFIMLAWVLYGAVHKYPGQKIILVSLVVLFLGFCVGATAVQARYWQDSETLFKRAVEVTKDNPIAYIDLGAYYLEHNQPEKVLGVYAESQGPTVSMGSEVNVSQALSRLNRDHEAIEHARRAVELDADHYKAHLNYAHCLNKLGDKSQALEEAAKAVELQPDDSAALSFLGKLELESKNYASAITHLEKAVASSSHDLQLLHGFGEALQGNGNLDEASGYFRQEGEILHRAVEQKPDSVEALNNYAWFLTTCPARAFRDGKKAVELSTKACEFSNWKQPLVIGTLAAALAEAGRFDDAAKMAVRASQLAASLDFPDIAKRNNDLMKLYLSGKPYQDP